MASPQRNPDQPRPAFVPEGWSNPPSERRYDLVIVGGTRAGVAAALAAAELGARAALVARDLRYEDNTVRWLASSLATPAAADGHSAAGSVTRFAEVSNTWRRQLAGQLPLWELLGYGVDVFFGRAHFVGPSALAVDSLGLEFRRALVAIGPSWATFDSADSSEAEFLTPEALAMLDALPQRLLVIGQGSQACEIAQAFCRLGSDVHLVSGDEGTLPREDRGTADWVEQRLAADGLRIDRGWKISGRSQSGRWSSVVLERHAQKQEVIAEQIVALGNEPLQLGLLDPVAAGIRCGPHGMMIDRRLQTANRNVYALGAAAGHDCLEGSITALARLAVRNALLGRNEKVHHLLTGRATYTDPQLAHLGLSLEECDAAGHAVETRWVELADVGRTIDRDGVHGLASLYIAESSGRLLGVSIAASQAAALAAEMSAHLCTLGRWEELADCTSISAEHQRAVEQIVAGCRPVRSRKPIWPLGGWPARS